jgi:hypothetical protein
MPSLLSRPYRLASIGPASRRNALAFGVFIFLFLFLFQPFGLSTYPGLLWKVAFGYGATCTVVMLVLNGFVPLAMPKFFSEAKWTVGREIGWTLVNVALIGLANLLYSVAVGLAQLSMGTLLRYEGYTVLIGLFPVTAGVLWTEARLSRRYRLDSEQVNAGMYPIPTAKEVPGVSLITIPSENGKEDLALPANELLFIHSAGNYLEVYQAKGARIERHVLRGSLKRTEEALSGNPRLLRCHKSHLVNLDRVSRVSGNAQGFQLHLDQGMEVVPVSRRLNDRIGGLLAARP